MPGALEELRLLLRPALEAEVLMGASHVQVLCADGGGGPSMVTAVFMRHQVITEYHGGLQPGP